MNEVDFCNGFRFNVFKFQDYHFTDHSKQPLDSHYFGCLITGRAVIRSQQQELSVEPGEIFYIPKGLKYQSRWFAEGQKQIAFYSFGFPVAPTKNTYVLQKVACTRQARELFAELCRQIPLAPKGIGVLYSFFAEVSEQMQQTDSPYSHPVVEEAIRYISRDPGVRMRRVAEYCGISESGLYGLFKKYTGQTPNDLRLRVLCSRAVALLSTTNRSVQQISDETGFSSVSYFRKVLRKYTGKTPSQIRKDAAF